MICLRGSYLLVVALNRGLIHTLLDKFLAKLAQKECFYYLISSCIGSCLWDLIVEGHRIVLDNLIIEKQSTVSLCGGLKRKSWRRKSFDIVL